MTRPNPIFAGLAEGLRPADATDDEPGTLHVDLDALRAAERLLVVKALEKQTELAERQTAAAERAADAAERQADAFEVIASLLASVTGVANQWCPGSERETSPVNYIRASASGGNFQCDKSGDDDDED